MSNVVELPDCKRTFPKPGAFNGLRSHDNIRADPDLGVGRGAVRRAACKCSAACAKQLELPWKPGVADDLQPRDGRTQLASSGQYTRAYEGENDWKLLDLCS